MRLVLIASTLGGAPILALIGMASAGWAAFWPAMAAILVTLAGAAVFAVMWLRDLDVLTDRVRQVASDEPSGGGLDGAQAVLMEPLAREVERLSRRVTFRSALQERNRRADTLILEWLPDPVIVIAGDRTLRRTNQAARAVFGDDIPAVLRHPGLRVAIDRALRTGQVQTAEIGLRAPILRDVIATAVQMDPPLTDGGQILVVLSDRTRERVVERMRADFVANVSHELRTPLASVIGFIETLQGSARDDPDAQKRFLEIMAEQGARMNRLIDDLLSLSRIELTEHQAPSEPVDLALLVGRLAAGFEPRLAQRGVSLDLRIDEALPPVTGDTDQLAQVMQNLLDNGLKYGRDGGVLAVTIRRLPHAMAAAEVARAKDVPPPAGVATMPVAAERVWPNRPGVVIAVSDQGAGIPKEHLPRLTERFYRVDKGRSRAVGGTGLGLAIVKHIVSRHRGQLLIESEENVGTTVSVWLPVAPVQPAAAG
jgi:two-component system, OmpR family, phosphate regulon sensor histidine kinase PhoR